MDAFNDDVIKMASSQVNVNIILKIIFKSFNLVKFIFKLI